MTTEQFYSNQEQLEAYWRDFSKLWEDSLNQLMMDEFPDFTTNDRLTYKQSSWQSYLLDALIDCNPDF